MDSRFVVIMLCDEDYLNALISAEGEGRSMMAASDCGGDPSRDDVLAALENSEMNFCEFLVSNQIRLILDGDLECDLF